VSLRRGTRIPPLVPVASMGDIAFLLIIFFMLTSNFIKERHIHVERPSAPELVEMDEAKVSVKMEKDGGLWLNGDRCPPDLLEEGVLALLQGRDDKTVMVAIDRDVPHETFGPVFLALSRAGAQIALIGERADEPR
jgi:biopolymer transport protein ExbD